MVAWNIQDFNTRKRSFTGNRQDELTCMCFDRNEGKRLK